MFGALFGGKKDRRERLRATPMADEHRAILQGNVPWHGRLAPDARRELEGHVQVFLDEKRFEPTADFELDDEVRVTIAGHACLLIMHRPTDVFPTVRGV